MAYRGNTRRIYEKGRSITSTRAMWERQLKHKKQELDRLQYELDCAFTEARRVILRQKLANKVAAIADVENALGGAKDPPEGGKLVLRRLVEGGVLMATRVSNGL